MKILWAIIAAVLLAAFVGPIVVKLKEVSLWIVALLGFTMMLVDLVQSVRSGED